MVGVLLTVPARGPVTVLVREPLSLLVTVKTAISACKDSATGSAGKISCPVIVPVRKWQKH